MIRVGLLLLFTDQGWMGGLSYFRNLIGALYDLPDRQIEPVVITTPSAPAQILANFAPAPILRSRLVVPGGVLWKCRRFLQQGLGRDPLLERLLRREGIALLSHSGTLGRRSPVATLPWIPDFQELHYPEFFSAAERGARRRSAAQCCATATAVLLSSEAARADLASINPDCAGRARVLPFVASVPGLSELPSVAELESRHGFSGPYFHLPNQFWAHKNHGIVVEALRLLRARGQPVQVLATGNPRDHRQPGHYEALLQSAAAAGAGSDFRSLGLVSYLDLMGLMAGARAVLNPSLFEGWSTTVEEAKSLGKPVILSDLPVHREQNPPAGVFFDPRDPVTLAAHLAAAWACPAGPADAERMALAAQTLRERRREFAGRFQDIVLDLAASQPA